MFLVTERPWWRDWRQRPPDNWKGHQLARMERVASLCVIGLYLVTDGFVASSGAWFAYAPGTDVYFSVRRASVVRTVVAPVFLVMGWSLCSVWLLGGRPPDE
jgi:hypothetical protein